MPVLSRDRKLPLIMMGCLLGSVSVSVLLSRFAIAQSSPPQWIALPQQAVIPVGTRIPLRLPNYTKILVSKGEIYTLTLSTSTPLRDRQGLIVIPEGSKISGEFRPISKGIQFFAQKLSVYSDNQPIADYALQAHSAIATRTELITPSTPTAQIARNTFITAAAATIIAEITGDRTLVSETPSETTGIGLLAGWFLNGSKAELISINPNRDLTLTLQSPLVLNSPYRMPRSGI